MIKIKNISYQQDNVLTEVEYDLDTDVYSFTVSAKLSQIAKMTLEEIKDYIVGRVVTQRATKLRAIVEELLNQLIDVDLEEQ